MDKRCNQICGYCQVDAGLDHLEIMTRETAAEYIRALECTNIPKVDITGGALELNPNFRWAGRESPPLGRLVMDRFNLTVLLFKGQEDLADVLALHRVPYFQQLETAGSAEPMNVVPSTN